MKGCKIVPKINHLPIKDTLFQALKLSSRGVLRAECLSLHGSLIFKSFVKVITTIASPVSSITVTVYCVQQNGYSLLCPAERLQFICAQSHIQHAQLHQEICTAYGLPKNEFNEYIYNKYFNNSSKQYIFF